MKVLDSSFLVKLVLDEEGSDEAERSIKGWILGGEGVCTLDLALPESPNAIWRRNVRGELDEEECRKAAKDLLSILSRMKVYPAGELIMEALSIAMRYEITVYDSLYLALAVMRGADLATFDQKLRDVASEVGVKTFPVIK
ncbi:MAG: type II toxin-antitoxin system VapC family toxin [Candidatus Korarchaeota archaeon]|nr:type II toxin-antitoxin system VapC family toxin [Candidatus Korarchaeota archaeon]